MDRVHRLGQMKVVTVYRLYCASTIEEKILQLQLKKKAVSAALMPQETGSSLSGVMVAADSDDREYDDLDIERFVSSIHDDRGSAHSSADAEDISSSSSSSSLAS
jgi:SNF2 family DNA or RNA helicase